MSGRIEWNYPAPRPGWRGEWDRFIGPGATRAELGLEISAATLAALAMLAYALLVPLGWNGWQTAVAVLFAFDLAGGVVTNATSTAKRWYHRDGQRTGQHLLFLAVHSIHLALVAWLFRGGDWAWAVGWFAFLMGASLLVVRLPLYLQRPAGLAAFGVGLVLHQYLLPITPGLEWFIPVFLLKLLVSHLLREEPYREEEIAKGRIGE
jgi:hypothetical protein